MSINYSFTKKYLTKDDKPWFPVMGEIHFSRYRADLWEESLRKMKAGGLSIASVYVIWIHHEEEEGKFDFTGNRNLRGFLEAAKKVGISVFLRIGPWVHGEARNGGFPDWLQSFTKTFGCSPKQYGKNDAFTYMVKLNAADAAIDRDSRCIYIHGEAKSINKEIKN